MSVRLVLHCGGCDAVAEAGPLRKRWVPVRVGSNYGTTVIDDPEPLTPEGWVMFDPYTYATYCPTCWESIECDRDDYSATAEYPYGHPGGVY